ncbi:MAG: hypothetical protein ABI689_14110 [Thermoanaerobaculia bacterium]
MSELRPLRAAARAWICIATLGLTLAGSAAAQSAAPAKPAEVTPAQAPAPPVPRLRSRPPVQPPVGAAGEAGTVRLMVFSLERRTVFDALTVVRPLLSVQGSVDLDPNRGTISVRDNLAALSRVATAIRAFDRASLPVRIDVSLILAETAKISPIRPDTGIAPDLLARLRQLLRFENFSLLAQSQIASFEGEAVVYDMAQGYRLNFELGSVGDGKRIRLSEFRMVRALPGKPEHELVRSVVNLGLDQPLILGLTRDEASDRALMLVLRYQTAVTPTAATAGH